MAVGLTIVAQREEEMFFDILKAQVVDWRMAEERCWRITSSWKTPSRLGGVPEFERAIITRDALFHPLPAIVAHALRVRLFKLAGARWASALCNLMSKRSVAQRLVMFAQNYHACWC